MQYYKSKFNTLLSSLPTATTNAKNNSTHNQAMNELVSNDSDDYNNHHYNLEYMKDVLLKYSFCSFFSNILGSCLLLLALWIVFVWFLWWERCTIWTIRKFWYVFWRSGRLVRYWIMVNLFQNSMISRWISIRLLWVEWLMNRIDPDTAVDYNELQSIFREKK